jgi:hypothetical protein
MAEELKLGVNNGIFRKMGSSNLSKTFVTAEDSPLAALAKSRLADQNDVNNLTRLLSWCLRHHVEQGLDDITVSLVGRTAIGGFNLSLAAQVETGIISPEALGVPLSRHALNSLRQENEKKQQRIREMEAGSHKPGD